MSHKVQLIDVIIVKQFVTDLQIKGWSIRKSQPSRGELLKLTKIYFEDNLERHCGRVVRVLVTGAKGAGFKTQHGTGFSENSLSSSSSKRVPDSLQSWGR